MHSDQALLDSGHTAADLVLDYNFQEKSSTEVRGLSCAICIGTKNQPWLS